MDAISELEEFLEHIGRFPDDDTFRYELDRKGAEEILAAFRAAENDALEKAAVACDGLASPKTDYAAEKIRSLKHQIP